ncbi:Os03g0811850 [Oryza sativa Japonica Group]|uniref:Os03g0811850 protein n=1 Tax=Oryza sativa subsp. japonica TaxID=39947 RepID=A0A0P0W585_ORYSJ|nr:Os03g0811850 [Oryza sativa Japonica Group]
MAAINPVAGEVAAATAKAPPPAMATVRAPLPANHYSPYHSASAAGSYAANTQSTSSPVSPASPAMISSSSSSLPPQQQRTWQPQPTTFSQANPGHAYQQDHLPAVAGRRFFPPPAMQMQYYHQQPDGVAMVGSGHPMAAPVHSSPLATTSGSNHAVVPDAPPQEPAKRRRRNTAAAATARRGRGRPRGATASSAHSAPPPPQQQQQPTTSAPAITAQRNDDVNQEDDNQSSKNSAEEAVVVDGGEPPAATSALAIVPRHGDVGDADRPVSPYSDIPGVRFTPTDQELIIHFLKPKYNLRDAMPTNIIVIKQLDVCKLNLDELHGDLGLGKSLDGAWYVFSPRSRYKERGVRPARGIKTTAVGYWKSNSAEADVVDDDGEVIGRVNSLTLALGHQPRGKATHWRMKEYRIPQFQIPLGQEDSNRLDSKPDGGLQDQSADDYNAHICNIEASKPDGALQDLSVDDYGICDIDFAPKYADPSSEEMHERNIGEI